MDPTVIALGLQIGNNLINLYSNPEKVSNDKVDYEDFLENTANRLELIIKNNNNVLIEKIENDRLEILQSRIKHYSRLIRKNIPITPHDALPLEEEVGYAATRCFKEKKQQWLPPYLAGQSLFIVLLKIQKDDEEANRLMKKMKRILKENRIKLLEFHKKDIFKDQVTEIPWLDIHQFIEGESETILEKLMDKICNKCGSKVKHDFSFCTKCGESLN